MSGPWHAVDGGGRDLATGRPPRPPGLPSPAAALAAAPVVAWPLAVVSEDGCRVDVATALGGGGERVHRLLEALTGPGQPVDLEVLAPSTPAGLVDLPVAVVGLGDGVEAAAGVDPAWLGAVERARDQVWRAASEAGRDAEVEAAVHLTVLMATERFDPKDDTDVGAHVASGARLWLLTGAVVAALTGAEPDPFTGWARLVTAGWWPVGPSGGRLVVARGS